MQAAADLVDIVLWFKHNDNIAAVRERLIVT